MDTLSQEALANKLNKQLPAPLPKVSSLSTLVVAARTPSTPSLIPDSNLSNITSSQPPLEDDPTVSFRIENYSACEDENGNLVSTGLQAPPVSSGQFGFQIPTKNAAVETNFAGDKRVGPDDFDRLRCVGQGGYGKVFLVRRRATDEIFAMKVLKKATLVIHTKTVEHTKNERSILSQVAHNFIVKLHYAFQTPEKLFLILQYAPGGNLFRHLSIQRMFHEDTAAFYIGELLLAIDHLHSLGIIYRDLKPENVLLDAEGHVLLTDFGLSKVALETRTICGTLEYTAPEVFDEAIHYGRAVDYWSLGAMLFDMITGSPPFTGNNRKKVMEGILKKKPTFPPYLTSHATDLIKKLLTKNPELRLGANDAGAAEIMNHRYFRKINWKHLAARQLEPPIQPDISNSLDTRNFHECYTGMPLESPPAHVLSKEAPSVGGGPGKKKKNKKKGAEEGKGKMRNEAPVSGVSFEDGLDGMHLGEEAETDAIAIPAKFPPQNDAHGHHFHGFSYVREQELFDFLSGE